MKCEICGRDFKNEAGLKRHITVTHGEDKKKALNEIGEEENAKNMAPKAPEKTEEPKTIETQSDNNEVTLRIETKPSQVSFKGQNIDGKRIDDLEEKLEKNLQELAELKESVESLVHAQRRVANLTNQLEELIKKYG